MNLSIATSKSSRQALSFDMVIRISKTTSENTFQLAKISALKQHQPISNQFQSLITFSDECHYFQVAGHPSSRSFAYENAARVTTK